MFRNIFSVMVATILCAAAAVNAEILPVKDELPRVSVFTAWGSASWGGYSTTLWSDGRTDMYLNGSSQDRVVGAGSSFWFDRENPQRFSFQFDVRTEIGLSPAGGQEFEQSKYWGSDGRWGNSYLQVRNELVLIDGDGKGAYLEGSPIATETAEWISRWYGGLYLPGKITSVYMSQNEWQESIWVNDRIETTGRRFGSMSINGNGVVPEPASFGLLGLGSLGLLRRRRSHH